ncbi:LD-carboxypeptidase [Sphingomonas sp. S1-29]|uniref:LD-carboxypeptidase n=1 Tax=Sphingomonas sp. S1-29 TaxID=2991074 RepID=UPI00224095C1|nr:LD-carboxypeptidase [Sphingomonas sp. S1-29]UZK68192.1 LD-carboxypeptidase [Sphingomonas sp. S1-29]
MKIAVVAPARSITPEAAARAQGFAALLYPQVELTYDPQCFADGGHFAGNDALRAETFLKYANDPGFAAIWFARGGYGSNRILDVVMPGLGAAARAKTYMGYSDMGFVLGALYARGIGKPVHGPMATEATERNKGAPAGRALAWLVEQNRAALEPGLHGRPAAAFNMAILTAMLGTPWMPDLTDHVLILEEVGEAVYRIDRMMWQIADATQLRGIAGIRLGSVTAIPEGAGEAEFGDTLERIMLRWCRSMNVPYLGRAAVGHDATNTVVPFGVA